MDAIPRFTTEFARLLWQMTRDPNGVDAQKATLRNVLLAREADGVNVELGALNIAIVAARGPNGFPEGVTWVSELTTRMAAHAVRAMFFGPQVPAIEILGVARALAAPPQLRDDGQAFDARMVALKLTAVTVTIGRDGFVRHATPHAAMPAFRSASPQHVASVTPPAGNTPALARHIGRVTPPAVTAFRGDLRERTAPRPTGVAGIRDASREMMSRELSASGPAEDVPALRRLLADAADGSAAVHAADQAWRTAEHRADEQDWHAVASIIAGVAERLGEGTEGDVRRAYLVAMRRLSTPKMLRGIAPLLPTSRELRDELHLVFANSGEAGVDALIELMTSAQTPGERRAYFDALKQCPHAAPMLGHMLGDPQWFVVRNAADLLGEIGATELDSKLVETLSHPDARVRRAATGALARLGTPRALHALQNMLRDSNPDIRRQAALGLGAAAQRAATGELIAALQREQDMDVEHALITALGKVATPPAVERLAEAAQRGGLFRRRPTALRIAAINALGEAASPEAMAALRELARDRHDEVRAAAERVLRERSAL